MQRAERASLSARQAFYCSLTLTVLKSLSDQPDTLAGQNCPFLPICRTLYLDSRLSGGRLSQQNAAAALIQQSALQVNVEALPDGPENPYGNGFIPVETDLTSELKAQRVCDPMKARLWKIKNPGSLHPVTGVAASYGDQPERPKL